MVEKADLLEVERLSACILLSLLTKI